MHGYKIMKGILLAFAYICMFFGLSRPEENRWSTNGPPGGSIYSIEIHPQNPQVIFVGTIQKGIYKTTDGGNLWNHIESDEQMSCMRVIAIHPYGPDTIYATSTRGIYKSINAGINWAKLYPPQGPDNEYSDFLIHPEEPNLLFAGGPLNEWKSTNSGQTWEQLNIPHLVGIEDISVDPTNTDVIYIATNTTRFGYGIFRSTDRGQSWTNIQNNITGELYCQSIAIDPQNTHIIYLGLENPSDTDNCLFKSINDGQSWIDISPPDLSVGGVRKVAVSPFANNIVFVCTWNDGVLKSTDGGLTWIPSNEGLKIPHIATIEFDIFNEIIYLGTYEDGIYKSINDGNIWEKSSENIDLSPCQSVAVCPIDLSTVCLTTLSGLYATHDGGHSWSYAEVGFPFYHAPGDVIYDQITPSNIYLTTKHRFWNNPVGNTGFYRSTDGGNSWEFFITGLPGDNSYIDLAISYLGGNSRRIFLSSYRGVYFSDNIGETWIACSSGIPQNTYINALEVAPSDQNIIAAGTGWLNNEMFLSTDRGVNWHELTNYPDTIGWAVMDIEFDPLNQNIIYVGTDGAGIFKSSDGGLTWLSILNDLPANPDYPTVCGMAINPYNPSNVFVSSSRYGIYQSHNGGQNWEPFNNGLDTTSTAGYIKFAAGDTNQLYFASQDRSVWAMTRTATVIIDDGIFPPRDVTIQNYPNPFNSSTVIEFALPQAGEVSLTVYDILGRQVSRPVGGYKEAGNHSVTIDMGKAGSGVYYYILNCNSINIKRRMLLLK
jgi:photosystem II stability/assembly factor-like uncharacterized protein